MIYFPLIRDRLLDVLIAGMTKELEKKRERNAFQKGIRSVSWMLIGFMAVMVPIVRLTTLPLLSAARRKKY